MHRQRVSPNNENDTLDTKQMKNIFTTGKMYLQHLFVKLFFLCGFTVIKQHAGMKKAKNG